MGEPESERVSDGEGSPEGLGERLKEGGRTDAVGLSDSTGEGSGVGMEDMEAVGVCEDEIKRLSVLERLWMGDSDEVSFNEGVSESEEV